MALKKENIKKIISDHRLAKNDTGSTQVQVALLTERINQLGDHLKKNSKDNHSRYGLLKLVGQRKRLLVYLQKISPAEYRKLITRLELRK